MKGKTKVGTIVRRRLLDKLYQDLKEVKTPEERINPFTRK